MSLETAILLPARNEERGLPRVLPGCLRVARPEAILVVSDGSTDGTVAVAQAHGVGVLALSPGRGKGGALRAGFERLLGEGWDAIITIDGDGQHDPAVVPRFVEVAEREQAALVIGARPTSVSLPRRLANWSSSGLLSLASGQRVADAQSGYRLYRASLLREVSLTGEGFGFETDILVRALALRRRVAHVPIETIAADRPSHIDPVRDVVPMIAQHVTLAAKIAAMRAFRAGERETHATPGAPRTPGSSR
jgi:glycosyltransferase involved in cell wall biosynthesis